MENSINFVSVKDKCDIVYICEVPNTGRTKYFNKISKNKNGKEVSYRHYTNDEEDFGTEVTEEKEKPIIMKEKVIEDDEYEMSVEDWMTKDDEDFSHRKMSRLKQIIKEKEDEFVVGRKAYNKVMKYAECIENSTSSTKGKNSLEEIKYILNEYIGIADNIRKEREF
ncbi:hypothetical protein ENUP19_0058G0012 [Entamoeba nuttalli]|uniref:Uncharacterized protein n=1 Tax=Entamoeba nuttalli TaxID=412467 RepID=A0ABQ0DD44_9EUKA